MSLILSMVISWFLVFRWFKQEEPTDEIKKIQQLEIFILREKTRSGEIYYVYDAKSQAFLTQATTQQKVVENLKKIRPNVDIVINREHMKEIGWNITYKSNN